ncbi:acyl-CoA synthetase FdrA [Inediibacterium massiliense]|uniref:acyl-CoA synthetase FdrA n=1 Tax=Inediibacterium massiliense TaxID=1658111 RepID=UPI0006B44A47|nr:acyl-CoA synthetase FdrA [Inediibacterium massiliense]
MLHTIIQKNSYQDSVTLMLLTNQISTIEGVKRVSIMMGTPANKDIFEGSGLRTKELDDATANDMAIVLDVMDTNIIDIVLKEIKDFLNHQGKKETNDPILSVKTWEKALEVGKDVNLALISIPGIYAYEEANRALDKGKHVFMFSDNVSIEDELKLKEKAHEKGLLVMGPDCGTGIISGIPMAFTNKIRKGNIGIVGASGTGIQEVSTIIDRLDEGVTHAIGTGGRDLSEKVGGITMIDSLLALDEDDQTKVIVVISKPPAIQVRNKVVSVLRSLSKPTVAIFLGEKPTHHEENIYYAYTLEEAAKLAVGLVRNKKEEINEKIQTIKVNIDSNQKYIKGLYSGGTLANEAGMLIGDALHLSKGLIKEEGYILKSKGHEILDLGDDIYTRGKPHPMIDPQKRIEFMKKMSQDENTAVILFDIVLGYGSHSDMASQLAPVIKEINKNLQEKNRSIIFVATVCGTPNDKQDYKNQIRILKDTGVIVADTNNKAVRIALQCIGYEIEDIKKEILPMKKEKMKFEKVSPAIESLLKEKPYVLNMGLKSFTKAIEENGAKTLQFDWKPKAGGNIRLQKILHFLNEYCAQ